MICVWVNKRDWRHPGPIVNMAVRNAHSLASLGVETHLCLGAGQRPSVVRDLQDFYGLHPLPTLRIHLTSRSTASWVQGRTSSGPIFRAAMRLIISLLRERPHEDVTVLTREGSFLPRLCWLGWRFGARLRIFCELHDYYADLGWRKRESQRIKIQDIRQQWLERTFLPRLNGLICITEAQRALYRKKFPTVPSLALPLGTDPAPGNIDHGNRRALRQAVYVGRLSRGKGLELLLRAAQCLCDRNIRFAFWGGNPEQIGRLRARAAALGIAEFVEGVSTRSPEELRDALARQASVGLLPLEDNFYNRYLTCPVKALDYLSHALPVVASDLESCREVLGSDGAGHFFPPGQERPLAEAVANLLDDPERYARATVAARRRAQEISWRARAKQILRFVEESSSADLAAPDL